MSTLVRLKLENNNKNIKILIFILVTLAILLGVLVFNPFDNIKKKIIAKRESCMNTTPTYVDLKTTEIISNTKYLLPVSLGMVNVNSDNSMNIKSKVGMKVKSIDDGLIYKIGNNDVYGNYIEICYTKLKKDNIYAFYGFLDKPISGDIIVIQKGQKLGEVGKRGYIFFELRDENHNTLNPYEYMKLT